MKYHILFWGKNIVKCHLLKSVASMLRVNTLASNKDSGLLAQQSVSESLKSLWYILYIPSLRERPA